MSDGFAILVEHINPSVAEIPDQDCVIEPAEAVFGDRCKTPWGVEYAARGEPGEKTPACVEDVDISVSGPRFIVLVIRTQLFSISYYTFSFNHELRILIPNCPNS